jgi:hypothetical protein
MENRESKTSGWWCPEFLSVAGGGLESKQEIWYARELRVEGYCAIGTRSQEAARGGDGCSYELYQINVEFVVCMADVRAPPGDRREGLSR